MKPADYINYLKECISNETAIDPNKTISGSPIVMIILRKNYSKHCLELFRIITTKITIDLDSGMVIDVSDKWRYYLEADLKLSTLFPDNNYVESSYTLYGHFAFVNKNECKSENNMKPIVNRDGELELDIMDGHYFLNTDETIELYDDKIEIFKLLEREIDETQQKLSYLENKMDNLKYAMEQLPEEVQLYKECR